jgi:hypothetical protein
VQPVGGDEVAGGFAVDEQVVAALPRRSPPRRLDGDPGIGHGR